MTTAELKELDTLAGMENRTEAQQARFNALCDKGDREDEYADDERRRVQGLAMVYGPADKDHGCAWL